MKGVAQEAGVALATVSKVINGIPVGEECSVRVEKAIKKLNYRVNIYAQGMKSDRTRTIQVIMPNLTNPFFAELVNCITKELARRNYKTTMCMADGDPSLEQAHVLMAEQHRADGIICPSAMPMAGRHSSKNDDHAGGGMMKKAFLLIMICGMLAGLTGCGAQLPTKAVDGTSWSEDWLTLDRTLGIDKPGHGLTLRDDKAARNMCYAGWSIGEAQPYTNASGEETNLYDAQLVLLLIASDTAEEAQMSVDEWLDLAAENYTITDTARQTCNGQEFTVLTYTFSSETSPFAHGISAFTTYDTRAISVELACQDSFEENAWEIMEDFLNHCHYAAES